MPVQEAKKFLRIGVFRGKQQLEERVVRERVSVSVGQEDSCTFTVLSSAVPKKWNLFVHDSGNDKYTLHLKRSMHGRVVVANGSTIILNDDLQPGNGVNIIGDEVYITLTNSSRGRIVIGKINILFQFVSNHDEKAVARILLQGSGGSSRISEILARVLALSLLFSLLFHLVPLIYVGVQDWPRDDELLFVASWMKEVKIQEMQVITEDEEEPEPVVVEDTTEVLPSVEPSPEPSSPEPGTVSRSELMDQITDKHREQGAMITAQILGVDGGVEGFYADMLSGNAHIADMSDIAAGDIGTSASGNLLNQLAAAEGGSGAGLMGLDSGKGNSGPKVVVDNKAKNNTQRAKVEFKMTDKSDFAGSPPPGSKEAIEGMFRKKQGDIKSCYQRVMNAQGKAAGRFVIAITVTKEGTVLKVDKIEDQIGGEMFQCVRQRIMNWKFGVLKAPIAFKKTWVFS